jgi:hypothetical protein
MNVSLNYNNMFSLEKIFKYMTEFMIDIRILKDKSD